jgi:hypothetical protein
MNKLIVWWNAYRRYLDLNILWPACKLQASDLDHAKGAFALHALNDPAWVCLGKDEVVIRIDALR